MNTTENNKLIAEFMELLYDYDYCDNCGTKNPDLSGASPRLTKCCSTYDKNHKNAFYNTEDVDGKTIYSIGKLSHKKTELLYHTSWDWLMPVVEKIEFQQPEGFNVQIEYNWCCIYTAEIDFTAHSQNNSKIEAVYSAVLEYISWHNENKTT